MKKLKLTPWYPPHIKPVRIGWYEAAPSPRSNSFLWYWNGRYWGHSDGYRCSFQERAWRGVAK
jgi:hypothetical protein